MQASLVRLFLTPSEAGELLGCSSQTVRMMVRRNELRAERRGRNLKIPRVEVERVVGMRLGPSEEDVERRELVKRAKVLVAELNRVLADLEA